MLTPNIRTKVNIPVSVVLEYAKKMIELNIVSRIVERSDDLESLHYDLAEMDTDRGILVFNVLATRRIGLDPEQAQDSVLETVRSVHGRSSDAVHARNIAERLASRRRKLPLP